jgi:hypothetical protein
MVKGPVRAKAKGLPHMTDQQSLMTVLNDLNKGHWMEPLQSLARKFSKLPSDESFEVDLLNMLLQLRTDLQADPGLPIQALAAIRFSSMSSFCYRFFLNGRTLNPLQDPEPEFKQSTLSQAQHAFPAPDILRRWSREHLT